MKNASSILSNQFVHNVAWIQNYPILQNIPQMTNMQDIVLQKTMTSVQFPLFQPSHHMLVLVDRYPLCLTWISARLYYDLLQIQIQYKTL